MAAKNIAEKYIEDILEGRIIAGELERLAVERHVKDLQTGIDRGLYFDRRAANDAIRWFSFLRHSKGSKFAGLTFELSDWQAFIVWSLFGWKRASGTRRFRKAYISVAKKNGKTTFAAGLALYMLRADGEPAAEVYSAATRREQAKICFTEAQNMVRKSPGLKNYFTVYQHSIFDEESASYFHALAADYDKQDGINPHFAIIDEYHAHKDDGLVDNIDSAMGARQQPLILYITTRGTIMTSPCYDEEQAVIKILRGVLDQDDKFGIIFSLDKGDNWEDPAVWRKSNPNIDISVSLEYLEGQLKNAQNQNRKITNFKVKNLNMWSESKETWIQHKMWQACAADLDMKDYQGRECWGGLDLASHTDFNAFSLVFESSDPGIDLDLLIWLWIPEDKLDEKRDRVDYRMWKDQGWIRVTKGNVIDIDQMLDDIMQILNQVTIQSIGVDPSRFYHGISQALQKEDIPVTEFRQNTMTMDAPTRELEKMVLSAKIRHQGNPALAWMLSNVVIFEDTSGNIKASKGKSIEKIDGVISTIMAVGEKMTGGDDYVNFS
jgi:phage terminase large subunit-like protein